MSEEPADGDQRTNAEEPTVPPDGDATGGGWIAALQSSRRKTLIACVAAVLIGGLVGGGILIVRGNDEEQRAATQRVLEGADTQLRRVSVTLKDATTVKEVSAAGAQAAGAEQQLRAQQQQVIADLGKEHSELAGGLRRVGDAQLGLLAAITELSRLRPEALARFPAIQRRIANAATQLKAQTRKPVTGSEPISTPDASPAVLAATARAGSKLRQARRKLRRWETRWERARRERHERLAVIDSYAASMRGYLARYDTLRSEMDRFIANVDDDNAADPVTFQEAYDFLSGASSSRASVSQGIRTLDAPPSLAAVHTELSAVLKRAAKAVDEAYAGTVDYQYASSDEYESYRDTPGWSTFGSESSQISGQYASARAAWERRVKQRRSRIRATRLPAAPDV